MRGALSWSPGGPGPRRHLRTRSCARWRSATSATTCSSRGSSATSSSTAPSRSSSRSGPAARSRTPARSSSSRPAFRPWTRGARPAHPQRDPARVPGARIRTRPAPCSSETATDPTDQVVVWMPAIGGRCLVDPTDAEIAEAWGIHDHPAGTGARLRRAGRRCRARRGSRPRSTAASEGLRTLVVERESIGGQAGSSSLIRNYLGFSRGISGAELAQRGYQQAWVFGAHFLLMREVSRARRGGGGFVAEHRRRR